MAATFYMKKIDLIEAVSKEIKITRSEAKQSVEIILEEISSAIVSGKGVEVRGFGGFQKRHRQQNCVAAKKRTRRFLLNTRRGVKQDQQNNTRHRFFG